MNENKLLCVCFFLKPWYKDFKAFKEGNQQGAF